MQEKWNQFVYYLREAKKNGVEEPEYHSTIEAQLQLLGWMRYKNEICHKLAAFVARYMPDKFYMSPETGQREDLRWNLMREVVANMLVHFDASSGYACFLHIFKDRVLTKNPTRLLPEIPEGELTIHQLSNYTKNPLLARVFHELHWVEDLGSGVRNILRYAPLYYPDYSIEINSGSQFLFSITYADATDGGQKSKGKTYVHGQMSKDDKNVQGEMSKENVQELSDEELSLKPFESKRSKDKKKRRIQAIMGMIAKDSHVSLEAMANQLDNTKQGRNIAHDSSFNDMERNVRWPRSRCEESTD